MILQVFKFEEDTLTFGYVRGQKKMTIKALKMERSIIFHSHVPSKPDNVEYSDLALDDVINANVDLADPDVLFKLSLVDAMASLCKSIHLTSSQDDKSESVTSSSVPASSRPQESPYIDPRPSQGHAPRNPLSIGDDDLAPNFGGYAPHAGGGMIMGPDHPLFRGRGSGSSWDHGGPAVPPGARFDPIGPYGQPGRPLGPGRGRGRGGRFPGEPDADHMRMPGGFDPMM